VRRLIETHDVKRALYAGDDTTDLDGFRALDGLELAIRVAVLSREGPAALYESADLTVEGPGEFRRVLHRL
jgi:trehalose 6-phosphate phosphatase